MRISVIIPTYNRRDTLDRALSSVLAQSSPADEVIVVDDGSSDDSAQLVEQGYPEAKLIRQENRGVSAARNRGLEQASHEWIALLDSDDEWLPAKLETVRATQHLHTGAQLFHSDEIWIRNGVRVNAMNKHGKSGGMIFEQCLPLCVISPSAAVIRRAVFDQIGVFNESLPACEDYDLWLRLCHLHPVHYIDQALIRKYGGHADQLSRKHWGMDRFRIQALHDLMAQDTLSATQRDQAAAILKKKLRILIGGARKRDNQAILNQYLPLLEYYESNLDVRPAL